MTKKELIDTAIDQTIGSGKKVNGVDVFIWLARHVGYLFLIVPIFLAVFAYTWSYHLGPKVDQRASHLDSLIIIPMQKQVDTNTKQGRQTYYVVKKIELIQERTTSKRVVKEAEEEIEIEKLNDE